MEIGSNPPNLLEISGSGWYSSGYHLTTITAPDTIVADATYFFNEWLVNGKAVPGNPISVNIDSALIISANYRQQIKITITTNIGSGTKIIVDEIEHSAPYETKWLSYALHKISVKEYQPGVLGLRYSFNSWNDGKERTHSVSPEQDKTYIASLDTQYYLDVITNPEGLFSIADSGWYKAGQSITLTEAPQICNLADQTYRFRTWKIDDDSVEGNPITIIMNNVISNDLY